jgi:RNA methyltransferase, TrmH family
VIYERPAAAFAALAGQRIPIYAAVPSSAGQDAIPCSSADLVAPAAFLIGNEGGGLSQDLLDRATARITIPTPGPTESLNAGVAASILLYEAARQRGRS